MRFLAFKSTEVSRVLSGEIYAYLDGGGRQTLKIGQIYHCKLLSSFNSFATARLIHAENIDLLNCSEEHANALGYGSALEIRKLFSSKHPPVQRRFFRAVFFSLL